jgi:hypothetical protein
MFFEGEVDAGEREISTLRHENEKLRAAVQSLVSPAPEKCQQLSEDDDANRQQTADQMHSKTSEAQRVAVLIDQTSRSVVEETYSLIDQTSKMVVEDTEEVKEVLKSLHERSTSVVGAAFNDIDTYMDSFIDHTSRKVVEDTEEVRGAFKTLHEKSAMAMADMDQYLDNALTESARNIDSKRNHVLQTLEEWRTDSADMAKLAQAHLEELGGKTQEQAQALLGASLWQWVQKDSSNEGCSSGDDLSRTALELGDKTQERINALGASLGWWSSDSQQNRSVSQRR